MAFKTCIWQKTTWTVPLPVILSVAFALLGGVAALWLTGMLLDIYAQLGLIMLIGLCAKSTILMVEFSMQERASGKSVVRAALNGANYRYRAVLMTAWSFIFGVLPLLFASGAGAESRKVIGTTTFWGMLTATILGVAFIPPLYTMFQIHAGDLLKTDEDNWIAVVVYDRGMRFMCEDEVGGFSSYVNWEACEIIGNIGEMYARGNTEPWE